MLDGLWSRSRGRRFVGRPEMDKKTRHEIWLLTIGTILVEVPVAFAVFMILTSH
jgi:hypothetical protein